MKGEPNMLANGITGYINIYKSESGYRGGHIWNTKKDADSNRESDWVDCIEIKCQGKTKLFSINDATPDQWDAASQKHWRGM